VCLFITHFVVSFFAFSHCFLQFILLLFGCFLFCLLIAGAPNSEAVTSTSTTTTTMPLSLSPAPPLSLSSARVRPVGNRFSWPAAKPRPPPQPAAQFAANSTLGSVQEDAAMTHAEMAVSPGITYVDVIFVYQHI
jgi:hypothetical protein